MDKLEVIDYQGIRVLTTQQLAEAYGTSTDTITKNFNRNKDKYIEGKHYICLAGKQKNEFLNLGQFDRGLKNARILYLWTKKGAFLHAKSLNTDTAWEIYERLVDSYFDSQMMASDDELMAKALVLAQKKILENEKVIKEKEREIARLQGRASAAQYKNLITNLVEGVDEINVLIKIFTFVKAWSQ